MLDFTSALYLDFRHESWKLSAWPRLTMGRPAVLVEPPAARVLSRELAALVGCERGVLLPSTLHLFWDLFNQLASPCATFLCDAGAYPIARWALEWAAKQGARVVTVPHFDASALARYLAEEAVPERPWYLVVDGYCPGCGRVAPLEVYAALARRFSGSVILDDSQAFGLLGAGPSREEPYGRDGGGALRYLGLSDERFIVAASLAKGFGVPVALLAGAESVVESFFERSETRVHTSPPSCATLAAVEHALLLNTMQGANLRQRLASRVERFRRGTGLSFGPVSGDPAHAVPLFPVQRLAPASSRPGVGRSWEARALHAQLTEAGVGTLLQRSRCGHDVSVTFVLTAAHTASDVEAALAWLHALAANPHRRAVEG